MTEAPKILLAHHLKTLKLPTFLREHDKLARQCGSEGLDHVQFLRRGGPELGLAAVEFGLQPALRLPPDLTGLLRFGPEPRLQRIEESHAGEA